MGKRLYTDEQLAWDWIKHNRDIRFDEGIQKYRMYIDGCWLEAQTDSVLMVIQSHISGREPATGATIQIVRNVEALIRLNVRVEKQFWDNRGNVLVMKSRTMEWAPDGSDFSFVDHRMSNYATRKLDFDYDPDATAPSFMKVLDDALPNLDDQRMLQEFLGLSLTTNTDFQVMLWVEGPPGSGKTTILDAFVGILGNEGLAANVPIQATMDKFGLAHIAGATLLWSDDQTLRQIKRIGPMSELVDGEWLRVEAKNKDRKSIRSAGKVLWIMNVKPRIDDSEGINIGLWRRLHILEFAVGYNHRDVSLRRGVLQEKAGIFNWALDGLERLLQRGDWQPSVNSDHLVTMYRGLHGAVDDWVTECTQVADARIGAKDAYNSYKDWCEIDGVSPVSPPDFAFSMERLGHRKKKSSATGGQQYLELGLK